MRPLAPALLALLGLVLAACGKDESWNEYCDLWGDVDPNDYIERYYEWTCTWAVECSPGSWDSVERCAWDSTRDFQYRVYETIQPDWDVCIDAEDACDCWIWLDENVAWGNCDFGLETSPPQKCWIGGLFDGTYSGNLYACPVPDTG